MNQNWVRRLKKSVEDFNCYRRDHPQELPDLSLANLSGANLSGANLSGADLWRAKLSGAGLWGAIGLSREDFERYIEELRGSIKFS